MTLSKRQQLCLIQMDKKPITRKSQAFYKSGMFFKEMNNLISYGLISKYQEADLKPTEYSITWKGRLLVPFLEICLSEKERGALNDQ
jgi:hypothetical protein